MTLLQIDSTLVSETSEQAAEAAKGVIQGDFSAVGNLIDKLTTFGIEAGKAILAAVFIYIIGRFLIRLINNFLARVLEKRNIDASIQGFLKSLVNILLTVLLFITVVSALGINTTSFAALLASIGLAFGMALSGNLQNFAGGLMVLLLKPFRVGDYIEAQGTAGTVAEIQIFHTLITTPDNKRIYLPNGALSSGNIVNYNSELRRVDFTVGVEYDSDAEQVKKVLMDIVTKHEKVITNDPNRAPFVALSKLGDSSVEFTVRAWAKGADYWTVFFEVQQTIYAEFNRQGIGFPFPQLTVHQGK
ncbi:MAG: mechanosensitive ion channel [Bacteroidaceae bacterium]|nr:mechanosensitive ion channel [Bacteroidaceae bacterium]